MIRCIVFSRDRAMQVDALLNSIVRVIPRRFDEVHVLYKATSDLHERAYELALTDSWARMGAREHWRPERDFRGDLLELAEQGEALAFHCDDDYWYRPPPLTVPLWPRADADELTVSYRLGFNTIRCQPLGDVPQAPPDSTRYVWQDAELDYAYPYSLDGHVFDGDRLRARLEALSFDCPNELEHALHVSADPERDGRYLVMGEHSSVVSVPLNRVNERHPNPAGDDPAWHPDALAARYLAGDRLHFRAVEPITAAHQIIEPTFSRG